MPRHLPPTLSQVEDMFYRSGPTWAEVFTLKPEVVAAVVATVGATKRASDLRTRLKLLALARTENFLEPAPTLEPPLVHWEVQSGGRSHRHAVRAGIGFPAGVAMGPVVARAYCYGQLLVGKVNTKNNTCCVAFEGRVFEAMRYEVLVVERGRVEWVTCRNGYVPPSAMPGGVTLQSNKIYPVRVHINGSLIPGQIIKGERCCRIPYEKHELMFREYEVLTLRCSEDKRPGPSRRLGPTDEEWEEFVLPKSCHQPDIHRLRNGDYTVPPSRKVCLPPSDSSEGGDSSDSGNRFNPPVLDAGDSEPGPLLDAGDSEPGPLLAAGDSEPGSILATGDCVPGPSHQMESVTRPSDCADSPSPSQGPRPRL